MKEEDVVINFLPPTVSLIQVASHSLLKNNSKTTQYIRKILLNQTGGPPNQYSVFPQCLFSTFLMDPVSQVLRAVHIFLSSSQLPFKAG